MQVNEIKLRNVLKLNALFSVLNGIVLLAYEGLADLLNASAVALMIVGVGLLVFGIIVWLAAVSKRISRKLVLSIILQDSIWVVTSLVVVTFGAWDLTDLSYWLISGVALVVLTFAWLQLRYLKRIAD